MPLSPLRLKFLIYEQDESITSLAKILGCSREELSKTIRGVRTYPRIRTALASFLGRSVGELFGETQRSSKRKRAA